MAFILEEKIRVGISACNAGAKVRWNRAGWDRLDLLGREKSAFLWTPVCPEVMAGLGTPREPIRLVGGGGEEFWDGGATVKNRRGEDLGRHLRDGAEACLAALRRAGVEAFVFMEGSPSCGVYRTTLAGRRLGRPPGVFGALLLREDLFLIPAADLESPVKWWDWRRRLHAFAWLKRQDIDAKSRLYEAWHALKFLCQEVDDAGARRIGAEIANLPRHLGAGDVERWRLQALRLLRQPSTLARISSVMLKHFAHYRKHFNPAAAAVRAPRGDGAKRAFVEELLVRERRAVDGGHVFGGTPVIYREPRLARGGRGPRAMEA
jgi:uncharacterized protein YbbK (DUF523 family)